MQLLASTLQIFGLLTVAATVATVSLVAGGVLFGAFAVLVGLALERR